MIINKITEKCLNSELWFFVCAKWQSIENIYIEKLNITYRVQKNMKMIFYCCEVGAFTLFSRRRLIVVCLACYDGHPFFLLVRVTDFKDEKTFFFLAVSYLYLIHLKIGNSILSSTKKIVLRVLLYSCTYRIIKIV